MKNLQDLFTIKIHFDSFISVRGQNLKCLINGNSFFPLFFCHLRDQLFEPRGTGFIELELVIFSFNVNFQLSLSIKRKVFKKEGIHTDPNGPDIRGFGRKSILSLELMFRASESWST